MIAYGPGNLKMEQKECSKVREAEESCQERFSSREAHCQVPQIMRLKSEHVVSTVRCAFQNLD